MYMSAHVLMILCNDKGKRDTCTMRGLVEFNTCKFNKAVAKKIRFYLSYDTLLWPLLDNVIIR